MSTERSSTASSLMQAAVPYIAPPVAAGMGIVPAFKYFIDKSAAQLGSTERVSHAVGLKEGLKTAHIIGGIVGSQMLLQAGAEWGFAKIFGKKENGETSVFQIFASAALVGGLSAPGLIIFNGRTVKQTAKQAVKTLTPKLVAAIMARETAFLFFSRMTKPVGDKAREAFGDNYGVRYGSTFFLGMASSIAIHPADTAVTRWQKQLEMPWDRKQIAKSYWQSMAGAFSRGRGIGIFYVGYEFSKEFVFGISS